jgi:hypothetical protein
MIIQEEQPGLGLRRNFTAATPISRIDGNRRYKEIKKGTLPALQYLPVNEAILIAFRGA